MKAPQRGSAFGKFESLADKKSDRAGDVSKFAVSFRAFIQTV